MINYANQKKFNPCTWSHEGLLTGNLPRTTKSEPTDTSIWYQPPQWVCFVSSKSGHAPGANWYPISPIVTILSGGTSPGNTWKQTHTHTHIEMGLLAWSTPNPPCTSLQYLVITHFVAGMQLCLSPGFPNEMQNTAPPARISQGEDVIQYWMRTDYMEIGYVHIISYC